MTTNAEPAQAETLPPEAQIAPTARSLITRAESAVTIAQAFEIDSAEMADMVSERRNESLRAADALETEMKSATDKLTQVIKQTRGWFSPSIERFKTAANLYGGLLTDWNQREAKRIEDENRAKAEAARRARQEADAKAAQERARAEQIAREERAKAEAAERQRQEAETRARAEQEARAVAQRKVEEEKRAAADAERRAADAKARGAAEAQAAAEAEARAARERQEAAKEAERRAAAEQKAQAEAAARAAAKVAESEERAISVVTNAEAQAVAMRMQVEATIPEMARATGVAGTSFRPKWIAALAEGVDAAEAKRRIVEAASSRPSLLGLIEINETALRKQAESLRTAMDVPGYVAKEISTAVGKRKS